MSVAEPWTPSVVAAMVADPFAMAVTRPEALTVAMFASDDDQVNVLPEIAVPFASCALGVSWTVSPSETSVAVLGVTATEATVGDPACCCPGPVDSSPPQAQTVRPISNPATSGRGPTGPWMKRALGSGEKRLRRIM